MAISDRAKVEYEAGQSVQDWENMSDSGDHLKFESTFSPWSKRSGFEASVRPYGLSTGGAVSVAASGSNDVVDVAALTAYMPGASAANAVTGIVSVAADADVALTRGLTTDTHMINSITVTEAGAIAVVVGTDNTAFSTTRGAAGGPPFIPVDSIEIAQVRMTSVSAAVITADEIRQVVGDSLERWDFPTWGVNNAEGEITFTSALPLIHTGGVAKRVAVKGYTPIFAELPRSSDFVPAEQTHSVNSTQVYNETLGAVSSSLNQASFTFRANDGITDNYIGLKNETLWHRFYPDRAKAPYSLTNGKVGISRSFPVDDHISVSVTISAEEQTMEFAS